MQTEASAQFEQIKLQAPDIKPSDLMTVLVPKKHQTQTSSMRFKYLAVVKQILEGSLKDFKVKAPESEVIEQIIKTIQEAACMCAHAYDKTLMLLISLILGSVYSYFDYHKPA